MEEISCTDHGKNEYVSRRVNEDRFVVDRVKRKKTNWICQVLLRNSLLKHIMEGKI
jgi:hypothetical protein